MSSNGHGAAPLLTTWLQRPTASGGYVSALGTDPTNGASVVWVNWLLAPLGIAADVDADMTISDALLTALTHAFAALTDQVATDAPVVDDAPTDLPSAVLAMVDAAAAVLTMTDAPLALLTLADVAV